MAQSKIPKDMLEPLAIGDADIDEVSLVKIAQSGASENQTIRWNGTEWEPASFPVGQTFVDNETPTGLKNGTNKEFFLTHLPNPTTSLQLFRGGVLLVQGIGNDYTLDNKMITFANAPGVNDVIVAYYRR